MDAVEIVPVVDEGLGNSSYVVGLGDGGALVVDPARNPRPYLAEAERRGWRIRFVAETHLHADFVSGSLELAALGAEVIVSGGAPVGFPARHVGDGGRIDLGGLELEVMATPGHTPEHVAYLVVEKDDPQVVFTGGTLIVGGVARPDLLGPEQTVPLARAAYRSLERLMALPDGLRVYPTHGAGSFCSAGRDGERTSTIGAERVANPFTRIADEDEFVRALLAGLGSFPPYFLELRDVNRAGPAVYGPDAQVLRPLRPDELDAAVADGAEIVDVRDIRAFAAGHVPGSLSVALRPQFPTWLGWLVPRDRPLVFVADTTTDRGRLAWAALTVGFEQLVGELDGGVPAWAAAGRPVATLPLVGPDEASGRRVVDVRQSAEWEAGHVDGAVHVELGDISSRVPELSAQPLLLHCGHGERAMTAASLLARGGHRDVAVLAGGPRDLSPDRASALG